MVRVGLAMSLLLYDKIRANSEMQGLRRTVDTSRCEFHSDEGRGWEDELLSFFFCLAGIHKT